MTNGDAIRSMSDAELAQFLELVKKGGGGPDLVWKVRGFCYWRTWDEWYSWLKRSSKHTVIRWHGICGSPE